MKNKIVKNTFIITMITVIAGLLLGLVYMITKAPIEKAKEEEKNKAYKTVLKDADTFSASDIDIDELNDKLKQNNFEKSQVKEIVVGKSKSEEVGYVFTIVSKEGFGGDIEFTVGIGEDGTTKGISFLSISETAGLGMQADTPEFKNQFDGKKVEEFKYSKTGASKDNEIDALSGATITTNAVTNGVNAALYIFNNELGGAK